MEAQSDGPAFAQQVVRVLPRARHDVEATDSKHAPWRILRSDDKKRARLNCISHLLGLITYFTAGPKEARAWTVPQGTRAQQAAGVIHTDFEKGFIRAETIAYDDYVALAGEAGARDAGKLRLEGKDYVVKDGDVLNFRFAT